MVCGLDIKYSVTIRIENKLPPASIRVNGASGSVMITKARFTIGRTDSSDLQLDSMYVGRKHAEIVKKTYSYVLKDLGSVNKTYLNGEELPPEVEKPLKDGDRIDFADVSTVFLLDKGGNKA